MTTDKKVFFIGDVALDEYYSAPYFPKIREKIIVHTQPAQMGGMIANAACVFASYGDKASFFTALNSGPISRRLCDGLREAGLDVSHMVWDDALPDSKTIVILAENEHTVFIPTLGVQRIAIPDRTMEALKSADVIYTNFCEIGPLYHKGREAPALLSELRENGCRLWCDLDVAEIGDKDEELFSAVDTLFVNEIGAGNLARRAGGDPAPWLFGRGVRRFVVTLAGEGCAVYRPDEKPIRVPGIRVPVTDVTGAGDTFCASFLYAFLRGGSDSVCARFANAAAAHAVTGMGPRAGAVGAEKVLEFMETHGIDPAPFRQFIG